MNQSGQFEQSFIMGVDPSYVKSAYVLVDSDDMRIIGKGIVDNEWLLAYIRQLPRLYGTVYIAIEGIQSFGMPVGRKVFETCMLVGRLYESAHIARPAYKSITLIYRSDEKMCICHNSRATDWTIRQALMDEYGEVGVMKHPGFFFGVSKDIWSAFAIAHTLKKILTGDYVAAYDRGT